MTTNYLILDVESTTAGKGDPFNLANKLCYVGLLTPKGYKLYDIEYSVHPYNEAIAEIQSAIDRADVVVGFNIKFDLHWLANYGIDYTNIVVYDIQLAEFIFSGQRNVYPSLDDTALRYGLGKKLDVVKKEYWDKGIDTTEVPREILEEYLLGDLEITEKAYKTHLSMTIPKTTKALLKLANEDLLGIVDMERTGLCYDEDMAEQERRLYQQELDSIGTNLAAFYPDYDFINWGSGDHVSAILFGGTIKWEWREEIGVYKTGQKIGLPRYKVHKEETVFPRLAEPAKGTELLKEGVYSVSEDALQEVKKASKEAKAIIKLLQRKNKLDKLVSTYYASGMDKGLLNLRKQKNWPKDKLHGKYDQCVAVTGRLAANSPNQQNFPEEVDRLLYSRFD